MSRACLSAILNVITLGRDCCCMSDSCQCNCSLIYSPLSGTWHLQTRAQLQPQLTEVHGIMLKGYLIYVLILGTSTCCCLALIQDQCLHAGPHTVHRRSTKSTQAHHTAQPAMKPSRRRLAAATVKQSRSCTAVRPARKQCTTMHHITLPTVPTVPTALCKQTIATCITTTMAGYIKKHTPANTPKRCGRQNEALD